MLRKSLSWILLLVCLLSSNVSAQAGEDRQLPTSRMLARFGLERAWWSQATINIYRDKVRHLVLDEDNLYVQGSGGTVTAFDCETGHKRWTVLLGRPDAPSYAPTSNDDIVLVNAGTSMFGLKKTTGDILWQVELPAPPSTSPVVDKSNIYYGTIDGSIYCFDLTMIQELHRDNRLPQWSDVAKKWRFKTAGEITSPPLIGDSVINFASRDKSLYSLGKTDRKLQWQFETKKPISAPIGRSTGLLFLGTEDLNLFCIGQDRGSVKWQFVAGLPIRKKPFVIENNVYLFPERGGVYSISKQTGNPNWWQANMEHFVSANSKTLFVTDNVGDLAALNRREGGIVGTMPLRDYSVRLGNELTDRIYLATRTGLVVCLRETGKEFPTYHLFPDRQPLLPEFAPDEETEPAAEPAAAAAGM